MSPSSDWRNCLNSFKLPWSRIGCAGKVAVLTIIDSTQNLSHIVALMPEPIARAFGDQFLEHSARWNKSLWHSGLAPDVVREMTPEDANDLHLFLSIMVRKVSERNQWESRLSAERMRELELAERQTTGS